MDILERIVQVLPRLKTKLQLTCLIALIGGIIATRSLRPSAVLAQISAGAIGVLFLIFGQVFGGLGQVRPQERAQLISRLFVIFVVFILALVLLTGIFLARGGNSASQPSQTTAVAADPALYDVGTNVVLAFSKDKAINQLADKLAQERVARDQIREPIRSVYSGLLRLRELRLGFRGALEARIALIDGKATQKQLDNNLQVLSAAAAGVFDAMRIVGRNFEAIAVDLDLQEPALATAFGRYFMRNTNIFQGDSFASTWKDKSSGELRELLRQLDDNTLLLNSSLDDLRGVVKKFFPDLGDLYAPFNRPR